MSRGLREKAETVNNETYIRQYLDDMGDVLRRLPREPLSHAVDLLFQAWRDSRTVFIAGNGGSASTAGHFACDLTKWTAIPGKKRFRVIALTDNMPLYSALVNDEGPASVYAEQLEPFAAAGDVLILISVHGGAGAGNAGAWSQNLLRALQLAASRGVQTIGLSGFDGGALKQMADICIVVPIDSTPHVESCHVAIEHLTCDRLRQRISQEGE